MSRHVQQEFIWSEEPKKLEPMPEARTPTTTDLAPADAPETAQLNDLRPPPKHDVPIAKPLRDAVEQGVFGATTDGPIDPDEEEVSAMTEEHGREIVAILADIQAVEDSVRTGEDPRTGKTPRTLGAEGKLRDFLEHEEPRLKSAYAAALDAYARGFGQEAASALDTWARKIVADCAIEPSDRYDPGHPWHYYHEGDNAVPIPVDEIQPDLDVGKYLERELPKNPAKRAEKLRALLSHERERVQQDKRRYQDIAERGAEALSRYDREIAHTSDEMARASSLALKYNHIRFGLGRLAWLESRVGHPLPGAQAESTRTPTPSPQSERSTDVE